MEVEALEIEDLYWYIVVLVGVGRDGGSSDAHTLQGACGEWCLIVSEKVRSVAEIVLCIFK